MLAGHARRRTAGAIAVLLAATLALAGCGSKTGENTSAAGASVDTSGDTVKVGLLNSLSGTMAISEVTVRDAHHAGHRRDQRGRRRARQEDRADQRGRRLGLADLRREGARSSSRRTRSPPSSAAGPRPAARPSSRSSRRTRRCCSTRCSTRAWSSRRTSSTPAPPPTSRSCPASTTSRRRARRRSTWSAATTSSRAPPTRSSRRTPTANGMTVLGEDYAPLGSTEFGTIVNKVKAAKADAVFNTLNGDSNVAFFKEYKSAGLTAASMPVVSVSIAEEEVKSIGTQYLAGQLTAWNYYQTTPGAANDEVRQGVQGEVRRGQADQRPDGGRVHLGLPVEGDGREGRLVRRGEGQGRLRRRHLRRARGPGHHRRRDPAHLQDRPDRQDRRRRPDHRGVELRRADQAGPVPQGLPAGRPACPDRPARWRARPAPTASRLHGGAA